MVGVAPCRTSSTTVAGGALRPRRAGVRAEADRADVGTDAHRRLCAVASNRAPNRTPWPRCSGTWRRAGAARAWSRWREEVARTGRASYAGQVYWGRAVPGFGDPQASLVIVGLAPAAHGANRTGRMFTGDRSGDWLFAALYRAGFASQPTSTGATTGSTLHGAYITAAVHCAPPANKPDTGGAGRLRAVSRPRALAAARRRRRGRARTVRLAGGGGPLRAAAPPRVRPPGRERRCPSGLTLLGSYHPSQQNTFTGKLTVPMFDAVFTRVAAISSPVRPLRRRGRRGAGRSGCGPARG